MRGIADMRVTMTPSRWRRWPISWARTARISSWFSCWRSACVTTSSEDATVRPKTNAFGEESPLTQIRGIGTPAWRVSSWTIWWSHGFDSGVTGSRLRIAHRTMKGEISHAKMMKHNDDEDTDANPPGNAWAWKT